MNMMTTISSDRIVNHLESNKEKMLRLLEELVLRESPTTNPISQNVALNIIQERFEQIDYEVIRIPGKLTGGYLIAQPANRRKNNPIQILIGHVDTVWPLNTLETMPLRFEDGRIKGPGVYDMKAGLVQIISALECLHELKITPSVTPVVLINTDEEKGSFESFRGIERLAKIAKRAFVLEPPLGLDGRLKTARKGVGKFTLTVKGKSAHAGLDPEKGVSAILELSHQIQQLFDLNDHQKGITVNVGMIEGGMRANVIAPISKAIIDVRVRTEKDGEMISQKIQRLRPLNPETELIINGSVGRLPMEKNERNQSLWLAAKQIGNKLGIELKQASAGGGSDGNITSQFTATLDGLGTTGDGAHAIHEFIFTDKIIERATLLTHLILLD